MKPIVLTFFLICLSSCSDSPEAFIQYLDGYWEIDEVTLPDGTKRIYGFNDTIDFIQISDSLTGFRKKLKPNLRGSFETSKDVETFQLKIEKDSLNIYYNTAFFKWKETILSASENELLVINTAKVRYLYKRYQALETNNDQTP